MYNHLNIISFLFIITIPLSEMEQDNELSSIIASLQVCIAEILRKPSQFMDETIENTLPLDMVAIYKKE